MIEDDSLLKQKGIARFQAAGQEQEPVNLQDIGAIKFKTTAPPSPEQSASLLGKGNMGFQGFQASPSAIKEAGGGGFTGFANSPSVIQGAGGGGFQGFNQTPSLLNNTAGIKFDADPNQPLDKLYAAGAAYAPTQLELAKQQQKKGRSLWR